LKLAQPAPKACDEAEASAAHSCAARDRYASLQMTIF